MIELKSVGTPTNGDKIRAMSDEELAEFISCPHDLDLEICSGKGTCLDCCIDWLHQPASSFSWPHENGMSARGHENIGEVSQ